MIKSAFPAKLSITLFLIRLARLMKIGSFIALLSCLVIAPQVWSACREAAVPRLPNPDLAVEAEMLRAQLEVRRYIALQEEFLTCVQNNSRKHNQVVDLMHEVANKYNSTARRYKARLQSMNMITELAFLELQ